MTKEEKTKDFSPVTLVIQTSHTPETFYILYFVGDLEQQAGEQMFA